MRRAIAAATTLSLFVIAACGKRSADTPPPASWEPDRSCTSNDDCTTGPTCCPSPCGGPALNKRDVDKLQRRVDATCNKEDYKHIVAGGCVEHRTLCVRGQCTTVMAGSPDWPAELSPPKEPALDTSCKEDKECMPARASCCTEPCTNKVINVRDREKAEAHAEAMCKLQKITNCPDAGACKPHLYACVSERCKIVYDGEPEYEKRRGDSGARK